MPRLQMGLPWAHYNSTAVREGGEGRDRVREGETDGERWRVGELTANL